MQAIVHLAFALLLAATQAAQAGEFSVSPIRLELGGAVRSGAVTVRNEDKVALMFQVEGRSWRQDESGQDIYEPAPELVFFPRLLKLEPGHEAVIRIGTRQTLVPLEKAYRLFIEELAAPGGDEATAHQVKFLVRFGAPVFVRPVQPAHKLALEAFDASAGQARWTLRNEGTRHERFSHIRLRGLDAAGAELFSRELPDRYLLAGHSRRATLEIAPDHCGRLARLTLEVLTDKSEVRREIAFGAPPCL